MTAGHGFARILGDVDVALAGALGPGQDLGARFVVLGASQRKVETKQPGCFDPGVGHVVAIPDPCVAHAAQNGEDIHIGSRARGAGFAVGHVGVHRLQISKYLAGMQEIGQAVDHGN